MRIRNLFSESTDRLQTIIAWMVYFFINVIFCIKYNIFENIQPSWFILFYPLTVIGIYKFTVSIRILQKNYFFLIVSSVIIVIALFLWFHIDRWTVEVDRWSALAFWSENLKNGQYPYAALTHLGAPPSPLPAWQLFHFPFYLLGDTAYGQLFCLLFLFIMLFCWRTKINIGGVVILLALAPCFWWEIAVRSDLLCNMFLLFTFITAHFYYSTFWSKQKFLTAAIIGLFLCTKMLVAIPLFLYIFPQFLKYTIKEKAVFALTVITFFIIPFLPFLFGEQSFLQHPEYNPFIMQSYQGSVLLVSIGGMLIFISALIWKRMRDFYFLSGLILFSLILTVSIRIGLNKDWFSVFFEDVFDISYFNVCIPFFLFFINEIKKRKFRYLNYHFEY